MITEKYRQEIIEEVLEQVKKEFRLYKKDLFLETESVLRTYGYNKIMIRKNKERIEDILKNGLKEDKVPVNGDRVQGGIIEYKGLPEREVERIQFLEEENFKLEKRIIRVENALECVKYDKYYPIIEMRYFKEWKWEEIEEELNVNIKTLRKQKSRLIKKMSQFIFQEVFYEENTLFS